VHAYRVSHETRPLVVVGSAPYSQWYVDKVRDAARGDARIRFTGGIYDQQLLDQLYANCVTYIHGHSVGGTNPSLLRAMGAGAPVLAYDVEFNREVTAGAGFFWDDAQALTELLDAIADHGRDERLRELRTLGQQRVRDAYRWDAVTDDYEALIHRLAASRKRAR
jgi:glycosyltransferase involved in cell wall biosynthesis